MLWVAGIKIVFLPIYSKRFTGQGPFIRIHWTRAIYSLTYDPRAGHIPESHKFTVSGGTVSHIDKNCGCHFQTINRYKLSLLHKRDKPPIPYIEERKRIRNLSP